MLYNISLKFAAVFSRDKNGKLNGNKRTTLHHREQGKKPMFRVMHVVAETAPFSKPLPKRVTSLSGF